MGTLSRQPFRTDVGVVRALRRSGETVLFAVAVTGLTVGLVLAATGRSGPAQLAWTAVTVLGLPPAIWWVVAAARERRLGADVVAVLALLGTLAVGEVLAGAIITVMLASGRLLEAQAAAR